MKKLLLLFTLACLSIPAAVMARGIFTDYPSDITALAYDGNYFWIGQKDKIIQWDKNSGIIAAYTPNNGLPGSSIRGIYIAPDKKTVWAVFDSCTARFDGTNWHTFTANEGVPSSSLGNAIFERNGTFWVLTKDSKGVFRYDGSKWTHLTVADGLVSDTVYAVAVDSAGVAWVGTDKGVSAYDGTTWKSYTTADGLSDNSVNKIVVDKNNVKWFGAYGPLYLDTGGITRFDGETWTAYNMANGKIEAKSIDDMVLGPDNTLYVSLHDIRYVEKIVGAQKSANGDYYIYAFLYKIDNNIITLMRSQTSYYRLWYSPLIVDNSGKLYVISDIPSNKEIAPYLRRNPLCDDDNVIWFIEQTWLAGYDGNERQGYGFGPPQGGYVFINALAVSPQNALGVGDSGGGISESANSIWTSIPYEYSSFNSFAGLCYNKEGMLWGCGDGSKLVEYQRNQYKYLDTPLPGLYNKNNTSFFAKSIAFDTDNTLWVSFFLKPSNGIGVFHYDGSAWTQHTTADGLINDAVNAITVDSSDSKWFGTSTGISRYDGTSWTSFPTAENGNPIGNVNALAFDTHNTLWAGTNNGLLRYDGSSWTRFTPKEGLADTLVLSLAVGGNGVVWAGTPKGLSRYDGKTWKTFTYHDYLPSSRVQALAVDHNGVVWIGTDQGLVSYKDSENPNFVNEDAAMPTAFPILSIYPNPFNPSTIIECTLSTGSKSELAVYALTGQKIRTLASEYLPSGKHQFRWDGKDDSGQVVSSGVYIAKLRAGGFSAASKMVLVK